METLPALRRLHQTPRYPARHRAGAGQPAQKRTAGINRNGFLRHTFLPFEGYVFSDWREAEAGFFRSADHLCALYGLKRPDVSGLDFPENMNAAYAQLSEQLGKDKGMNCYIMQDQNRPATLATAKNYYTGYMVYYIPVKALCRIMADNELKPLANLLVMICAYLYQFTKVDYYREPCYICSTYDTIEQWINDDEEGEEEEYRRQQLKELDTMENFGNTFLTIIKQPFRRKSFRALLKAYCNSSCADKGFTAVAEEIGKLITDYPKRSVYDTVPNGFYTDHESGHIHIEQYLSFYWSASDRFHDVFFDMVNNDLQESGEQIEPIALQWFDKPQEKEHFSFDYEARLFPLLNELLDFLHDYDYADEHHK